MNEQIKELMVKASSGACYDGDTPALYGHEPVNEIEEFAKLIIEECADYFSREGDRRFEVDGNWIAKTIKQHFGVEE